ncbi:hypothetical protein Zmor_024351 [Zophobas morio]|uniref:Uncharacterized protein n=1 Tax=Zophobas morio TaxID=2755281 RepID=A0AA38M879_9CUCU|nr:hypothetical protein Zmor_024351 [Zophobas morio]
MKLVFVVFAIFAVINSALCDSSEEVIENVKSKHVKKLLTKNKEHLDEGLEKLEKHCPGVGDKLKHAIKSFQECDDKVDDSLTICHAIQSHTLNCTKPLLDVVDGCLPQKAKGLPTLGVKSLLSVADFLCKQTGESIFELVNPCLWEDDETEGGEETENECEKKAVALAEKFGDENTIPTQSEICSTATSLRTCLKEDVHKQCKNQKTQDAVLGLFDAIVAPCSHINEV